MQSIANSCITSERNPSFGSQSHESLVAVNLRVREVMTKRQAIDAGQTGQKLERLRSSVKAVMHKTIHGLRSWLLLRTRLKPWVGTRFFQQGYRPMSIRYTGTCCRSAFNLHWCMRCKCIYTTSLIWTELLCLLYHTAFFYEQTKAFVPFEDPSHITCWPRTTAKNGIQFEK